jgi:beta-galactosidase
MPNSTIPVLGHEVGQWCAYPDFDVIKNFTGYLRPGNYEIWRDFAAEHGVLAENKQLAFASGKFQVQCYKQEIEANLRTKGMSGIQSSIFTTISARAAPLSASWTRSGNPKGTLRPMNFIDSAIPSWSWPACENYVYRIQRSVLISRLKSPTIPRGRSLAAPYWKIVDLSGNVAAQGTLPGRDIPIGKNIPLANVSARPLETHRSQRI